IAIKRVLTREGDSSYYINNQQVRRRDVADIFLGTGLGGRGYAIIEQGMISQIIEAKPEELRVFLEEAAGVSRYRERRRETELRLEDTRENLLRVDDIRQELEKQLAHLEEQAQVAARYQALQGELKTTQQLLWLSRRNEAGAARARQEREVQRVETELEAEIARLREAEKRIESGRDQHYQAGETLQRAQGELYAVNAEVSRLEQSLDYLRANRQRVENQIAGLREQLSQQEGQVALHREHLGSWRAQHAAAAAALEAARQGEAEEAARLPESEAAHRERQEQRDVLAQSLMRAEQSRELEDAHRSHAAKSLQQLEARRARLLEEQAQVPAGDAARLEESRAELAAVEGELAAKEESLNEFLARLPDAAEVRKAYAQAAQADEQHLTEVEARLTALEQIQRRLEKSESLGDWLQGHGLAGLPRLWQRLRIEDGWEDALEAALRDRLNALVMERLDDARGYAGDLPPARLTLLGAEGAVAGAEAMAGHGFTPLRRLVACSDPRLDAALGEWLQRVYIADTLALALEQRGELEVGGTIVTRLGHVVSRHSVTYYAPESDLHGVLGRQREIEQLQQDIAGRRERLAEHRARVAEAEAAVERLETEVEALREGSAALKAAQHDLQFRVLRLTQQSEQARARTEQIERELGEIAAQSEGETAARQAAEGRVAELDAEIGRLRGDLEAARAAADSAEAALDAQRQASQRATQEAQAAAFNEQTSNSKINEIENTLQVISSNMARLQDSLAGLVAEQSGFDEGPVVGQLQAALQTRETREQALATARDAQEGISAALRETEHERLAVEQKLEPIRSRIGDLKLKEQEARLSEEQFAQQLRDSGAEEEALVALLSRGTRASGYQAEINRLNEEIMALGAVNLAALEELTASTERKNYLDSQSQDLTEAMATLEAAIKRIDRETRERLMGTFDEVNRHLAELFPTLFGGGQARLVLTGEEILDSGVQIVAQPPGKRNSSIHLLSGGEKALTALSLVFSMFRLNPAPFCLLDEVDAPLDDPNTERFCNLVRRMAENTQFMFISHNKITMEMAEQLVGVTMQEQGVSHVVAVDIEEAMRMSEKAA
ncbi:MAG TPA: chromosome segregation protein SMC, partial [Burkholderiales bacterium]|nr:chromosome segregation protein SMC [Burkholderiales bacterium]